MNKIDILAKTNFRIQPPFRDDADFHVSELDVIRRIANELMTGAGSSAPQATAEFVVELNRAALQLQRDLQHLQLHLDKDAQRYIGHLQTELCQISQDCTVFMTKQADDPPIKEKKIRLRILAGTINRLFYLLIEEYAQCFNFQMKVPSFLKSSADINLSRQWNRLLAKLEAREVDRGLIDVLSSYFHHMRRSKRPSFGELKFWETLATAIGEIDLNKGMDIEHSLCYQFCYHNFNYGPLVKYCIGKLQRDYDQIENYREEFINITIQLKTFRQFILRGGQGWDPGTRPLNEVLCDILENELLCIKKLMNMNGKTLAAGSSKFFLRQFYFRISISIELFLFIFRLMMEKGIILVKRKADFFEFLHNHVGTLNKDNLSIGNMQNTFSENNRQTAIRARALLQSLVAHIDEKYLRIVLAGLAALYP